MNSCIRIRRSLLTRALILPLAFAAQLPSGSGPVAHATTQAATVSVTFEAERTCGYSPSGNAYGVQHSIVERDFNNDGMLDIARNLNNNSFDVLINDGSGAFGTPITTSSGLSSQVSGITASDFDGDGNEDAVIGGYGMLALLHGDGTGHFGTPDVYSLPDAFRDEDITRMQVRDLNLDGLPDLFIATISGQGGPAIYLGNGIGFEPGKYLWEFRGFDGSLLVADEYGDGIGVGDFNGDGYEDLLASTWPALNFLPGDGSGIFTEHIPVAPMCSSMGIADFNNDGELDFATAGARFGGDGTMVYVGDGAGGFSGHGPFGEHFEYSMVTPGDLNGDGNVDLVQFAGDAVRVFNGRGDGTLEPPVDTLVSAVSGSYAIDLVVADFNSDGRDDVAVSGNGLSILINSTQQTVTGPNTTAVVGSASFTFDNVTAAGATTVQPIADPSDAGEVPGGFAISSSTAYEIHSTASFTGSVVVGFQVPFVDADHNGVDDATGARFADLRILHREQTGVDQSGAPTHTLVDRTILAPDSPAADLATHTVYARVTSFSPFYLARAANKIETQFDRSRAYRLGSTVPVKVRLLNAAGSNISSAATPLTVKSLRLIGGNTITAVASSGNANPDSGFRYSSTNGGYMYNLSTRGLAAGRYVLSFYAGTDTSFLYTVEFEAR